MALYEVVLLDGDRAEVRLTDQPADVGDTLQINDEDWVVVRELPGSGTVEARLECKRPPAAGR